MNHGEKKPRTGVFKFGIVVILTLNIGLISEPWAAENEVGTPFELQKSGTISGIDLDYDLHFAPTLVSDDKGQPLANVYSFDYTVSSGDDAARAVTFLFEGGPGGSSAWLHLGFAGPRRFQLAPGTDAPLTGQLEDNRETILRDTDLVIIDPMGTGFTKAVDGVDPAQFWGVVGDGNLIARFVVAWLKNHDRLDNDVFFLGESYGGTRLPAVLHGLKALPETVNLQGVVLFPRSLTGRR